MLTLAPDVATRKTSHSRRNIQGHVPVRKGGRSVDPSVDILHQAVLTCVHLLEGDGGRTAAPDPRVGIALLFGQPPSTETLCIAMAIVTNALAFHEAITRELDLPSVADLRGPASNLPKRLLLSQWARVLPEARLGYHPPHPGQNRWEAVGSAVENRRTALRDGRHVRVRGASKVMCHCMFGVLALIADQLVRLVT